MSQPIQQSLQNQSTTQKTKNALGCYVFFIIFLLLQPIDECNISSTGEKLPHRHLVNEKAWILVYFTVSFLQTLRDLIGERINDWHSAGDISYRTRSRAKMALMISIESVHFLWQVYGNFIYYN